MPIDPGSLPAGISGITPELLISLTHYICGMIGALIVAVTWKV